MTTARRVGATWGVLGVVAVLADAVVRVWPFTRDAIDDGLSAWQWLVLVVWVVVMAWVEGYRGFQRAFAPRVVERAGELRRHGRGVDLVLAPLYCIGLFHAPRRVIVTSWLLTVGIVAVIVLVTTVDQPWRGIVDAGVLVGLAYGLVSVIALTVRAARVRRPPPDDRGDARWPTA